MALGGSRGESVVAERTTSEVLECDGSMAVNRLFGAIGCPSSPERADEGVVGKAVGGTRAFAAGGLGVDWATVLGDPRGLLWGAECVCLGFAVGVFVGCVGSSAARSVFWFQVMPLVLGAAMLYAAAYIA